MFASEPVRLCCDDVEAFGQTPAVFAIYRTGAKPYLGRTSMIRRRLVRLLRIRGFRETIERIDYWPVGSRLQSSLILYELAKHFLPVGYLEFLKLRMPPYVKLISSGAFPRTQVTSKLSNSGYFYGPFRTRGSAELFHRQMLDLFQLRRCQEDFLPSPDHPGCIYGEMSMCLRPCQEQVSAAEYASEARRVAEFLHTDGRLALQSAEAARDRLSAEMEFEAAARQHKRVAQIEELLKGRDDLARDIENQYGVAVTPGTNQGSVQLWRFAAGWWRTPIDFTIIAGDSASLDRRLRDVLAADNAQSSASLADRQEHMALLARWFYSSWRDGAWIAFAAPERLPYRRIVSAISRTVHQSSSAASH